MAELVAAFAVLVQPLWRSLDFFVVEPILMVTGFWIDFFSRYFLDARIGHIFIRTVLSPIMSYSLDRIFDCRRFFQIFDGMEDSSRVMMAAGSDLLNRKLLNEPLKQIISNVGTVYCDVMYGKETREDAFLFFYMCTYQTGRLVGVELGTGDANSQDNCFFPATLEVGPQEIPDENKEIRKKIAEIKGKLPARPEKPHKFVLDAGRQDILGASELEELTRSLLAEYNNVGESSGGSSLPTRSKERWNSDRNMNPTTYEATQGPQNGCIPENMTFDSVETDPITKNTSSTETSNNTKEKTKPFTGKQNEVKPTVTTPNNQPTGHGSKNNKSRSEEKNNLQIAMSCLFFSLLTYQTDAQLNECKKNGMIPGVEILTAKTGVSGTQMIAFVDIKHKYAVFGYRGTQFEVIRQMLTSLDFRLEYFETSDKKLSQVALGKTKSADYTKILDQFSNNSAHIRKVYMNEVKKSSEMCYLEPNIAGESLSPIDLIKYLNNIHGFKIYITGHSLGGGLATVLAARLMSLDIKFTAVVTFGGTPVGDDNFVKWFNKKVPCSWRFVFGDEFAPMVPPIPWAQPPEDVELVHVGHFYHIDLPKRIVPKNAKEANKLIEDLAFETGMMNMIVHHIPLMTMRALKFFYYGDDLPSSKRLKLDIGGVDC